MTSIFKTALILTSLLVSGCAASATPAPVTASELRAECDVIARREFARHGTDELAALPAICRRLERAARAHHARPANPAPAVGFTRAYEDCLDAGKHRLAMFTYRGHPGDPQTYWRVRNVCEAYAAIFDPAAP